MRARALCVATVLLCCLVIVAQGTFPAGGKAVNPKNDECHEGDTWTQDYCGDLPTVVFEESPFKNGIYNPYCQGYKKPAAAAANNHEAERLAEALSGGKKLASVKKAEAATSKAAKSSKKASKATGTVAAPKSKCISTSPAKADACSCTLRTCGWSGNFNNCNVVSRKNGKPTSSDCISAKKGEPFPEHGIAGVSIDSKGNCILPDKPGKPGCRYCPHACGGCKNKKTTNKIEARACLDEVVQLKFYCTSGGLPETKEGCDAKGDPNTKWKGKRNAHVHHCGKKWGWVKKEIDDGRLPREEMTRQKEALKACQTYHGAKERERRGFSGKSCEATFHAKKGCGKKWMKDGKTCASCALGENGKKKAGRGKCLEKKKDGTPFDKQTCENKGSARRKGAKWCSHYKSYAEELKLTKTNPTIKQLIARGVWPATTQPRKFCPMVQPSLFAKEIECDKQGKPQGCWNGKKGKKWQTRTPDNKPVTCMAFGKSCTAGLNYDPYSGLCANSKEGWNKDKKGRDATKCGYVAAKCETQRVFYNNHRGWSNLPANKQQRQAMDKAYKHGDVERYTYSFQKWTECWAGRVDDKTWRPSNFQCTVQKACTCTSCDKKKRPGSDHLGEDDDAGRRGASKGAAKKKGKAAVVKPVTQKCDCAHLPASLEAQVNRACAQL